MHRQDIASLTKKKPQKRMSLHNKKAFNNYYFKSTANKRVGLITEPLPEEGVLHSSLAILTAETFKLSFIKELRLGPIASLAIGSALRVGYFKDRRAVQSSVTYSQSTAESVSRHPMTS